VVVALGAWRVGAIYQPLFTAFGPAAIESRVTSAGRLAATVRRRACEVSFNLAQFVKKRQIEL
jgi:acyl-coenzyme A synthetase/AMP-(fatty) acid ligase